MSQIYSDKKTYYLFTLFGLFIFSLIGGFIGFQRYFINHAEDYNWLRLIYRTIQLFTLDGGDLRGYIPWELQLVRFSAPLATVMTFLMALLVIFKEQWLRLKIARMSNHIIIIGLGTKGKNVLEESLRKKERILIVESDPNNPNLILIRSPFSRLLLGDANNKNTLKQARITEANSVYLLMGNDTQQVNTCLLIYQLIIESRRDENNPLNCILHLHNQDFLNSMRSHNIVRNTHDGLVLSIFNVYENSARELYENNPPDRSGISINSEAYVQIIIFGLGKAGEALALQTALTGHYLNGKKPKLLIIDRLAKDKVHTFELRYPTFTDYCDFEYLAMEANNPRLIQQLEKYIENPYALNTIVLCFDNKTHNLLLGLQLESLKLNESYEHLNIFIRTDDNESFETFSRNIKPYGLPSNVCSREVIIGGNLDRKAKARHTFYLNKRKNQPDFGSKEADMNWENLSQELKDSNRKAVDHMSVKMRSIGCEIVSKDDPRSSTSFSEEEIEQLAKLEHRRWNAERSLAGWTFDNRLNDRTRKTPYLISWDELPRNIQEYDKDAVISIPDILEIISMKVVRHKNK